MARFGSMLTDVGVAAVANAVVLDGKVDIAKFAVGDGNGGYYMPTPSMTALKKECWRGNIAETKIDEISPNVMKITAILPSSVGGFTIREVGLFTTDNKMLAIGNMPDTEKIIISEGAAAEVAITMHIAVSNVDVVNIIVDPTIILATKKDIENHNISPFAHADIRKLINDHNAMASVHIVTLTHTYNADTKTHNLAGVMPAGGFVTVKFEATATNAEGDKWTVNGEAYTAKPTGELLELVSSTFISGDIVTAEVNILGKKLSFKGGNVASVPSIFGDGSDGDLIIKSGETVTLPVDHPHKDIIIKQYKSVSIASGGTLKTASNNCGVILKCQGDFVNNGTITQVGMAPFNNDQITYAYPSAIKCGDGSSGAYGESPAPSSGGRSMAGVAGGLGAKARPYGGGYGGGGGGAGASFSTSPTGSGGTDTYPDRGQNADNLTLAPGGTGGTLTQGAGTSGTRRAYGGSGGTGQSGGGIICLFIGENFTNTGTINCSGAIGGYGNNGYADSNGRGGTGGSGGGGGGGSIFAQYVKDYLNTGSILANAGIGGSGGTAGAITIEKYVSVDPKAIDLNIWAQEFEPITTDGLWVKEYKKINKVVFTELATAEGEWQTGLSPIPWNSNNWTQSNFASIGDCVYCIRSRDNSDNLAGTIYEYNTVKNTWRIVCRVGSNSTSNGSAGDDCGISAAGGFLYVVRSYNSQSARYFTRIDPTTGVQTNLATPPVQGPWGQCRVSFARGNGHGKMAYINNDCLTSGSGGYVLSLCIYDPNIKAWSKASLWSQSRGDADDEAAWSWFLDDDDVLWGYNFISSISDRIIKVDINTNIVTEFVRDIWNVATRARNSQISIIEGKLYVSGHFLTLLVIDIETKVATIMNSPVTKSSISAVVGVVNSIFQASFTNGGATNMYHFNGNSYPEKTLVLTTQGGAKKCRFFNKVNLDLILKPKRCLYSDGEKLNIVPAAVKIDGGAWETIN